MGMDFCVVLLAALFVVPPGRSNGPVAAVLMSLFLWVNHKPGRYGDVTGDRADHPLPKTTSFLIAACAVFNWAGRSFKALKRLSIVSGLVKY
jgi:hypothetical protein